MYSQGIEHVRIYQDLRVLILQGHKELDEANRLKNKSQGATLEYIMQLENFGIIFIQNRNEYFGEHFQEFSLIIYSSCDPE